MHELSLSTCWCSSRHTDGYEMVEEMVGLGFKRIELSHGIRISLVPGIIKAVEEGLVEISSLHNFCPLPNGVNHAAPNHFQPSAADSRERDLWARYSLQTFDFASRLSASHIIMHSGSQWFFFGSPEAKLERYLEGLDVPAAELVEHPGFRSSCERTLKKIRKRAPKVMRRIQECYQRVIPDARERGLKLCLENREGLEEMPMDDAWPEFLDSLEAPDVAGYWHDCGHAQIKHQMGVIDHAKHLEANAERLLGFHLHDVSEAGKDHQVPGTGTVDFDMIRSFVKPGHLLVLELSPRLETDQVLAARDYMVDRINR